jgi:DNA polymerase alpha subunit B
LPVKNEDGEEVGVDRSVSYELLFVNMISDTLSSIIDSNPELPTNIILIPSLADAHHEFVYPQPPFGDRDEITTQIFVDENDQQVPLGVLNLPETDGHRKRVHCFSNPCMFRVNEVLIGVTSNDNLFNMTTEEISENRQDKRLARLSSHIIKQQSFSPQFPPPSNSMTQMDWRHARHWQMKKTPDILIMPSKLTQLVSDLSGTLYINPGFLTKGVNGGSFAEIDVHPMTEKELRDAHIEGKTEIPHKIPQRSKVNILKI